MSEAICWPLFFHFFTICFRQNPYVLVLSRISFFVYDPVLMTVGRILGIRDRLTGELLLTQENTHTHKMPRMRFEFTSSVLEKCTP